MVGAAIGTFCPSQIGLAAVLGFCSHFALDAIPHWDYPIRSGSLSPGRGLPIRFDRALLEDMLTIGADGLLGLAAAIILFGFSWSVLLGALGAILPDPLQLVRDRIPHEPLLTLQRFHRWIHSGKRLTLLPFGLTSQLVLIMAVVALTRATRHF
jgi:hypothetical protein